MKPNFDSIQPAPASDSDSDSEVMPHQHRDAEFKRVWQRLSPRLARSAEQARRHVTARAADMACAPAPDGVAVRIAYDIGDAAVRPGEPLRIRLIDLPAGARVELPVHADADSAWLVLKGQAHIDGEPCATYDYQQRCAGEDRVELTTQDSARLMVREARPSPREPGRPATVRTTRAGQMGWQTLADGVSRRLLAPPQLGAAAYLVRMEAGAAAPAHRHGHAEECLLLEGEMYLDDNLLFSGDFQLAHAGGEHCGASSDQGVLLLAHGDLNLDVIEAGRR